MIKQFTKNDTRYSILKVLGVVALAAWFFAHTLFCDGASEYDSLGAARRPLVIINGQTQQLPTADYLSSVGGVTTNATAPAAGDIQTTTETAGTLTTTALLNVSGQLKRNTLSVALGGTAVNDWNPTGLSTAAGIEPTLTNNSTLTGITAQPTNTVLWLRNPDAGFTLTLANQSASSSAGNKFNLGSSIILRARCGIMLRYSSGSEWVAEGMSICANVDVPNLTVDSGAQLSSLNLTEQTSTATGTQNDFALNSTTTILRYTGASAVSYTGFAQCSSNRILWIVNGTTSDVTLPNNTGSSVGRKLLNSGAADIVLKGGSNSSASAVYICDSSAGPSWRLISVVTAQNAIPTRFSSTQNSGKVTLVAGTITATVPSGSNCVCTDTTAALPVQCSVSSTTLTVTGTSTDGVAYLCF